MEINIGLVEIRMFHVTSLLAPNGSFNWRNVDSFPKTVLGQKYAPIIPSSHLCNFAPESKEFSH